MKGIFVKVVGAVMAMVGLAAQAGSVTYYHNDLLGSPVVATDASGQVVWRESYRPYGERLTNAPASSTNDVWFTGRRQDVDTGLVYMGARYYDPALGRFISTDPKGFDEANVHSFNRYAYANNNPYRFIDPDGQAAEDLFPKSAPIVAVGRSFGALAAFFQAVGSGNDLLAAAAVQGLREERDGNVDTILLIGAIRGGVKGSGDAIANEGEAAANRAASRAQGIPDSQLGPSGLPKRHTVEHESRKAAKEAAEREAPEGGRVRNDANPTDPRQGPHFQAEDAQGNNARPVVHHEYPR
jgi:RHS repeat-associated protein